MARRIANTPACIEMRVPHTTREKLSRPRSSVPKGCAHVGGLRIRLQSVLSGSAIAIQGAPMASAEKTRTTTAPATAGGRRRARRQPRRRPADRDAVTGSAKTFAALAGPSGLTGRPPDADARVQERVRHVHEQIDEDVGAGGDPHHALDQ